MTEYASVEPKAPSLDYVVCKLERIKFPDEPMFPICDDDIDPMFTIPIFYDDDDTDPIFTICVDLEDMDINTEEMAVVGQ
ncbi:hypothetical protein LguiA_008599 [Lonicera macranthoides]